jgi:hypothetical protein
MAARYLLGATLSQDGTQTIVNAIEWDGATIYRPPEGQYLLIQQGEETIGWTKAPNGDWEPPPPPPPQPEQE